MKKEFIDWVDSSNGINELDKQKISYKLGENYLLVGEIIKRTY